MQPFTMLQVGARVLPARLRARCGAPSPAEQQQHAPPAPRVSASPPHSRLRPRRSLLAGVPLLLLQCMGELMEYTDLLDKAAVTEDPYER